MHTFSHKVTSFNEQEVVSFLLLSSPDTSPYMKRLEIAIIIIIIVAIKIRDFKKVKRTWLQNINIALVLFLKTTKLFPK